MEAKLKGLPDSDVTKLVNDAILSNNSKPGVKDLKTHQEIEAKEHEMRGHEAALANHLYDRLLSGGYVKGYIGDRFEPVLPLPLDLIDQATAIKAYHDSVLGYDMIHHIVSAYAPHLQAVLDSIAKIVGSKGEASGKNDTKKAETKKEDAKPAADKKVQIPTASFVGLETEGVPVLVQPNLMKNTVGDADLDQRNYIVEGINGYDFV
jgi:hypothetical protein